jgi:hypothetical protein
MAAIRVVHYVNQFFGGIGGEERAACRSRSATDRSLDKRREVLGVRVRDPDTEATGSATAQ